MTNRCPTDDELLAFSLGRINAREIDSIGDHLEQCSSCSSRLDALDAAPDALLDNLRVDAPSSLPAASPTDDTLRADQQRVDRMLPSQQFSIRLNCPHCRNPIAIVDEGDSTAVCPSCGSSIHVHRDETQTWSPGRLPKVGKFQLLAAVGQGAFGTVYRAKDTELDRTVAVKVPRSGLFTSPEDEQRFVREARAAARLGHAGIVPVFEVGRTDSFPYIVTEFVEGVTLADLLSANPFSFRDAAELVADVADAIHDAHQAKVVHRDLKPSNIMMQRVGETSPAEYRPRVMDFGLAQHEDGGATINIDGCILGTPAYGSPEQLSERKVDIDARSDVYSLGVILYELLAGELPFRGTFRMLIYQVLHEDPRPLRQLNDRIPRDLETICMKCLEKAPDRRYASAAALAEDLRRYLAGEPIIARPSGAFERGRKWIRRQPVIASLIAGVFLSLALGLVGSSYFAVLSYYSAVNAENSALSAKAESRRAKGLTQEAKEAKQRAEERLYLSSMVVIANLWERSNIGGIHKLLESQRPALTGNVDYRRFEWYYWWTQCHQDVLTLDGHARGAVSVAIGAKTIATGSGGGVVRVWDRASGDLVREIAAGADAVTNIEFGQSDETVAAISDGRLALWSVADGKQLATFGDDDNPIAHFAFAPDLTKILTARVDGLLQLRSVADGTVFREFQRIDDVVDLAYSPTGAAFAVVAEDGAVRVWNPGDASLISQFKSSSPTCVSFDKKGESIIIGARWGVERLQVFDAFTGKKKAAWRPHMDDSVNTVTAFSGAVVSGSTDDTAKVWSLDGKLLATIRGHVSAVRDLDHRYGVLATASSDGAVKLWEITPAINSYFTGSSVHSIAYSRDGRALAATARNNTVKIFTRASPQTPKELLGHTDVVTSIDYLDNETLATGSMDATVRLWDSSADSPSPTLLGKHSDAVTAVAFSPEEHWVASSSLDGRVILWDYKSSGQLKVFEDHRGPVLSIAVSPDGKWIASIGGPTGGKDRFVAKLIVWNSETLEPRFKPCKISAFLRSPGERVAFSPDGNHIATIQPDIDKPVQVWDAATGDLIHNLIPRGSYSCNSIAFSPDGARVAASHLNNTTMWDVKTGIELLVLPVFSDARIYSLEFRPDGRAIAAGSYGTEIGIWRCEFPDRMNDGQKKRLRENLIGETR